MTEDEFSEIIDKLTKNMRDAIGNSDNILKSISDDPERFSKLMETVGNIGKSLELFSLATKYLLFDLEATRRERDKLRMLLEDQQ
ncbi:hypothetical protein LCGC14_0220810 [marine sediment metagenome]|uniref:Uncharacterized protein n=1 Tax=marine sediment metagenome TaxID=412755 RepID=A0A0F9XH24_9ZZZZ